MKVTEKNVMRAFQRAKTDVVRLQSDMSAVSHVQGRVLDVLREVVDRNVALEKRVKRLNTQLKKKSVARAATIRHITKRKR